MERSGTAELLPLGAAAGLQLLATNLLAAGIAVTVTLAAVHRGPGTVILALLAGAGAGLLAAAGLGRSVLLVILALRRLARGFSVRPLRPRGHGPLAAVIGDLNTVILRLAAQDERKEETEAFRERLLAGVSAAAAQEERNRLARDLHDSIKQQIFSMSMSAAAARARWEHDPQGARAALADIERGAQEAQVEMAALLTQLRPTPLEGVGLQEALRIQCEALAYRTGAEVDLSPIDLPPEDRMPPGTGEALFRIAQELLANVARHARARQVDVRVGREGESLVLRVRDDGQGFDVAVGGRGTGLAGIQERAQALGGRLSVESVRGQGTLAEVRLPLQALTPATPPPSEDTGAARRRHERRTALKFGTQAAQISAILIFLTAPIAAILLGIAAAVAGYGRSLLLGAQLSSTPDGDGDGDIQERQWGLLASILGLLALAVWYLPVVQSGSRIRFDIPFLLGLSLPLALGALAAAIAWYAGRDRRLSEADPGERQRQIARRLTELRLSLSTWLVIVLVAVFFLPPAPALPPHSLDRWSDDAAIAILVAWPLIDGVDYFLATRRGRLLPPVR